MKTKLHLSSGHLMLVVFIINGVDFIFFCVGIVGVVWERVCVEGFRVKVMVFLKKD